MSRPAEDPRDDRTRNWWALNMQQLEARRVNVLWEGLRWDELLIYGCTREVEDLVMLLRSARGREVPVRS